MFQELMRHANSLSTLDVYGQAKVPAKREAQQRIVEMALPENGLTSEINLEAGRAFARWQLKVSNETTQSLWCSWRYGE